MIEYFETWRIVSSYMMRTAAVILLCWLVPYLQAQDAIVPTPAPLTPTLPEPRPELQPDSPPPVALRFFTKNPPAIQALIRKCFELDALKLGYVYGSADPKNGAMDCSGTIFYLLQQAGFKDVPRQADGFYRQAWEAGLFFAVNAAGFDSFEWKHLRPGDLLFWTGTYDVKRDPPVSHVMLYLGEEEGTGRKLMFGASENRPYGHERKSGVGVFDFDLPKPEKSGTAARFIGYAHILGLQ